LINKPVEVRFVSGNAHKIAEAQHILSSVGIAVVPSPVKINELQIADIEQLVRDKALKAFQKLGRPLFVEHTGLHLRQLNELPGGLTQVFWDTLQADQFAARFGIGPDCFARASTRIAYCDGQRIRQFAGELSGTIVSSPRGNRDFQWDCVFQPDGHGETFGEMGEDRKNEISMRRKALDAFAVHLKKASR
jgi:XTP/dITP diphosphohydrolase